MFKYTQSNKVELLREFNYGISSVVEEMYGTDHNSVKSNIEASITKASIERLKLVSSSEILSSLTTMVSDEVFKKAIATMTEEDRKLAWKYRALEIRIILLKTILSNPKKINFLVTTTLESLVRACFNNGSESITMSQLVHDMKLSATVYVDRLGVEHQGNKWLSDELRLQFISELAEMDYINVRISHKTHMVSIPKKYSDMIPTEIGSRLARAALVLSRKTILVEPADIDKDMISKSSWWYKTPMLSADQIEFVTAMHSLKWEFVPNALELIEDAYKSHLEVSVLPTWALSRLEEYKAQIRASFANGGHYIAGKFDSALRWYWQSEIGHTQTSEAMRNLVKPQGMSSVVKYDMSNNVVQMYAVALKDRSLAKYVGLVSDTEIVEDLRLQLAKYMNKNLDIDVFHKDNIKPLFMVWAYNAGAARLLDGVYSEEQHFFTGETVRVLKVEGLRSIVTSSGKKIPDDTIMAVWNAILNKLVPTIVELKRVMSRIVKGNPFTEASWVLPDGAIAQYASVELASEELHWVSSTGRTHQHTHHRKELVPNAKAAGLLPRSIHSMDAYMMRQLVIRAKRLGIVVVPNHDSFMFDEVHTDTMFRLVRELFIELMESNVFYGIVQQLNTNRVTESGEYIERELLTASDILVSTPMKPE